jgi:hypothetical protein
MEVNKILLMKVAQLLAWVYVKNVQVQKNNYDCLRKKVLDKFFCTSGFRIIYKELKLVACGQG